MAQSSLPAPATPALSEGREELALHSSWACPHLSCQAFLGKWLLWGSGCACVHSSIPHGQVPSNRSVGAFEIVRETDFLVRSCPVQLEGQILRSC